jgi:hypothetical protein
MDNTKKSEKSVETSQKTESLEKDFWGNIQFLDIDDSFLDDIEEEEDSQIEILLKPLYIQPITKPSLPVRQAEPKVHVRK